MKPFTEWAEARGITMTATPASSNQYRAPLDKGDPKAAHWTVTLSRDGRAPMTTSFTMGSAYRRWTLTGVRLARAAGWQDAKLGGTVPQRFGGFTAFQKEAIDHGSEPTPPEVGEVLYCLAADSQGIENSRSFEEWAGEYGYDTDSRSAEATYRTCQGLAANLAAFLGESAFAELLTLEEE